jgi:hypothetical protein
VVMDRELLLAVGFGPGRTLRGRGGGHGLGWLQTEPPPFQAPNPFLTLLTQLSPEVFVAALSVGPTICHLPCFLRREGLLGATQEQGEGASK